MNHIKLLLYINILVILNTFNAFCQEGHNLYFGGNYRLNSFIREDTSDRNCNNPANGICTGLNYDKKRLPLANIGYFYCHKFNSVSSYGFLFGFDYKSEILKMKLFIDDGYYEFYTKYGYYPSVSNYRYFYHSCYINTGITYSSQKFHLSSGISFLTYFLNTHKSYFFDGKVFHGKNQGFLLDPYLYIRFNYEITNRFNAYLNTQTPMYKQDFYRTFYLNIGLNISFP